MTWEQERRNAIARCAKRHVDCDEEEEIVLKLFRAQTRCEKRKWLAWREGRFAITPACTIPARGRL